MDSIAATAAAGIVGVALWELHAAYAKTAPSMTELRRTEGAGVDGRQRLRDADLMCGGLAVLAGAAASWLTRSWVPIALVAAGFLWVSGWHHWVLAGFTPEQL